MAETRHSDGGPRPMAHRPMLLPQHHLIHPPPPPAAPLHTSLLPVPSWGRGWPQVSRPPRVLSGAAPCFRAFPAPA